MATLPNASHAIIDQRKLTEDLLSAAHPVGRSKARFFERLGFTADRAEVLEAAVREHAVAAEATSTQDTGFGIKYIADGPLSGPLAAARIRTVWIVESGTEFPRFVTAYPGSQP